MKYNFDEKIDRSGTNAMKLEGYKGYIFHADDSMVLPFADEEFIHLWVADMEFGVAPEILDAIRDRLDRQILGYTGNTDTRLYDALSAWCKERYDFEFKREELVISNGVVPAIIRLIRYIVKEDEKVLFNTPAYGQFANACFKNGREYVTSDLIKDEDGNYYIDFEDMDKKMAQADVPLFILCNPHNPTGRAWSKEELEKIAELIEKHDMWVISDEIHCDLRRADAPKHIPLGKIMPDYNKLITCMAASKSFNIAGLSESSIIIRDEKVKKQWLFDSDGLVNPLSHEGTIAAYTKGGDWLKECNDYLDGNFSYLYRYLRKELPKIIMTPAQTTYLAWVDFTNYFEENEDVELFFAEKSGVLIEADKAFVDNANRMVRINLACPRDYLKEGLERMVDAIKNKHDEPFLKAL
ncbi:MalY/PatB family protein [Anaerococcus urinomassiliensis]|uniref:MalY/PatB family protein n=1 Tax=Anaerococcus urinomassiliensis TaxID=1745712 RepID=UPI00093CFE40|nr:aminotransferase class I/II-fold pyridoxal phosphate-dependent enzyme [Anaerococcus urinomassiliensis]